MNIILKTLKNQIGTFCIRTDGFQDFVDAFLLKKLTIKFPLAFMKALASFEYLPETALHGARSGFQIGFGSFY
jgi:hypothetical protein